MEKPNIEGFRPQDKDGNFLPMNKACKRAFAEALLDWHYQTYCHKHHVRIVNKKKSGAGEKDIELALVYDRYDNEEEFGGYGCGWGLYPFCSDAEGGALVNMLINRWLGELGEYPEMVRLSYDGAFQVRAYDRVRNWMIRFCGCSLEHLNDFDKLKEVKHTFLFGGVVRWLKYDEEKDAHSLEVAKNQPGLMLLTDTPIIDLDENWEPVCDQAMLDEFIAYLKSLFPGFEVAKGDSAKDKKGCKSGNYAVDALQLVLAIAFLPVELRLLVILYGRGNNGKSMLLDILHAALNNDEKNTLSVLFGDGGLFTRERDGSAENKQKGDRGLMLGKRFVFCQDEDARYMDAKFLKPFISGETVKIGGVYVENLHVRMKAVGLISSNHAPSFSEETKGLDRRIVALPCEVDFKGNAKKITKSKMLARGAKWAPAIRCWIWQGIKRFVEEMNMVEPEELPARLQVERDAILNKGRNPISSTMGEFLTQTKDGSAKMLLGGTTTVGGFEVGKKNYYGYMLVIKLLCDKNEIALKSFHPSRVDNLIDNMVKGRLYAGTAKIYRNIQHTEALQNWLDEETGVGSGAIHFLYSRQGDTDNTPAIEGAAEPPPAPPANETEPEARPDTGSPEDEEEDIPW